MAGMPYLQHSIDTLEVDVLDAVPGLHRRVDDGVVLLRHDAGVVVERVEAAEAAHRLAHQALAVVLARHVGAHEDGVPAPGARALARQGGGLLARRLRDIGGDDARALRAEHAGGHPPHAAAGAGDDAHFVL